MNHENIVLAAAAGVVGILLAYWHLSHKSSINLEYLFIDKDTGKFSLLKFAQFGAFFVTSWIIIRETNHDRLNEWLFAGYMVAWAGANIVSKAVVKAPSNAADAPK